MLTKLKSLYATLFLMAAPVAMSQDWPNLKAFQAANAKLSAPTPDIDRVVFMGNSITIGWKTARPEFFKENPFINRGISGQTTSQMLLRFRQDVIALEPKVVVILAGTNDIAENTGPITLPQILDNIKSMCELALAHDIQPVLCAVLPASEYPWRKDKKPATQIPVLNELIKDYAHSRNLIYVDYFSAMTNKANGLDPELAEDGVHPTVEGYKLMEPLVLKGIAAALKP